MKFPIRHSLLVAILIVAAAGCAKRQVVTPPEPPPAKTETTADSKPAPQISSKAPSPTVNGSRTLTRALGLKIGRIVIDPGHGGHDTGTIGPTGLREKDLVLDVGRVRFRVLFICGQPGPEYAFLRQQFKSDPAVELVTFVKPADVPSAFQDWQLSSA
mgnify:CR=1 FL=1